QHLAGVGLDQQQRLRLRHARRDKRERSSKHDPFQRRTAQRQAKKMHYSDSGLSGSHGRETCDFGSCDFGYSNFGYWAVGFQGRLEPSLAAAANLYLLADPEQGLSD